MEQATAFFVDVLGCELLYEREPPGDDTPRERLGVPAGSRIQAVRFLRCANGANIELFEFYSPDQREEFPRPSDVGIQHLAVYVDDLDAAAEHLRRHGVKLMSGPNPLPGPGGRRRQSVHLRADAMGLDRRTNQLPSLRWPTSGTAKPAVGGPCQLLKAEDSFLGKVHRFRERLYTLVVPGSSRSRRMSSISFAAAEITGLMRASFSWSTLPRASAGRRAYLSP